MRNLTEVTNCPTCKSPHVKWGVAKRSTGGVDDGRLRIHDVTVEFYLECEECSETIRVVSEDEALLGINALLKDVV